METVGSALGSHVAWPTHLVVERSNETRDKKKLGKKLFTEPVIKNLSSLPSSLLALFYIMDKSFKDKGIHVPVDVEVFGQEISVWILQDNDVLPVCNLAPISTNCIVAYVSCLYGVLKANENCGKFLFVNPFTVSYAKHVSIEDRARALSERLLDTTSEQLVFAPCNVNEHWILTIFDLEKDRVYLMDPLSHRNRDSSWKSIVDTAMSIVNARKGKKFKKSTNYWEVIKGPIQPDSEQCGFYVMRFMKDIIIGLQNDAFVPLSSMFKNAKVYSEAEIDDVREEWASYVIKNAIG